MPRLIYSDRAKDDLARITIYIADTSSSDAIALCFYDKLRRRCERLAHLPGAIGTSRPELGEGIRSAPSGNYLILFRYIKGGLEILTVQEGYQDLTALELGDLPSPQ